MPGFDGTGPNFEGPMTGGARGYCADDSPFAANATGYGRGYGRGRGRWCRPGAGRYGAPPGGWRGSGRVPAYRSPQQGSDALLAELQRQAAQMQQRLDVVNQRIESLRADRAAAGTPATEGDG